jgi:lactate permease
MLATLSCLPFLLVLVLFIIGRPGWQNGAVTLAITCILALAAFHAPLSGIEQALLSGSFTAATTLVIILPALLLYQIEEKNGGIRLLTGTLMRVCPERDLLVLLLVLSISPLLEAICGFGTGIIVSVPLFLALGIPPQRAAMLGLFGEMTTAYASMGNAIGLEAAETGLNINVLGTHTAILLLPLTLTGAIGALALSGGKTALRQWWWVALLAACTLVGSEWYFSAVAGAEVVGVLSSLVTGGVIGIVIRIRRRSMARPDQRAPLQQHNWKAVIGPGIVLISSQVGVHLLAPVRIWASHIVIAFHTQHFAVFLNSGVWLFLSFLCALSLSEKGVSLLPSVWKGTRKKMQPIALTILAFVLTASVMQASGMIGVLSSLLDPLGQLYLWIAPLIGTLGGWITGSNIGSNAMFSPMQMAMAHQTGLSLEWIGAVQNACASQGRMMAPSCLILASVAANVREKDVSRWTVPFVLLALAGSSLMLALIFSNTWAVFAWAALFGTGGYVLLRQLPSIQSSRLQKPAPAGRLTGPVVASNQQEAYRGKEAALTSYRHSHLYRRPPRDLHPGDQTRQLQQVFSSAEPVESVARPLIALVTTRSICAQDLAVMERLFHAGAIPLVVSGENITSGPITSEDAFQRFFEQEIWPLLCFCSLHRIQGICYLQEGARYSKRRSLKPLAQEESGLFISLTLLAPVLGLPFCSLDARVQRGYLQPGDEVNSEEDQQMMHMVKACTTMSVPAIEALKEHREELYVWLRRRQLRAALLPGNRAEPEQREIIRPSRTRAALLERKRRRQIRFTLGR